MLLAIGLLGPGHPTITKIGGIVTCVCAAIAWYTASAIAINGTLGRTVLPIVPLRRGATSY